MLSYLPKVWHIKDYKKEGKSMMMLNERMITIHAPDKYIIGIIFVNEIDLRIIDKKVIVYADKELSKAIVECISGFEANLIKYTDLREKLVVGLKNTVKYNDVYVSHVLPFASNNKNKASRNKRIMESIGLKDCVRVVKNVGTENNRHLRKRQG